MALNERDRNAQTIEKHQDGKRKRVEIDLTGDSDDDAPLAKTKKNASQQQTGSNSASAYQTPPVSSVPRSSQPLSRSYSQGRYESIQGSSQFNSTQHSKAERESWLAEEGDDANEILDSSQAADAQTEQLHHYG
jgi:hypothetical protein